MASPGWPAGQAAKLPLSHGQAPMQSYLNGSGWATRVPAGVQQGKGQRVSSTVPVVYELNAPALLVQREGSSARLVVGKHEEAEEKEPELQRLQ